MYESNKYDAIVIGAGAAGLMAAWQIGLSGKKVLLIEHTSKIGEKIRISGGGRCNFTNLYASPDNYICNNPHFVKSALASYTQHDFIKLVESYNISYHEKTLGQLFCDGPSKQIIEMMLDLCSKADVEIRMNSIVENIEKDSDVFILKMKEGDLRSNYLIIATGGLSIPKMGATDFGYKIAKKFGHTIIPTKPALVPLTLQEDEKEHYSKLAGISNPSNTSYNNISFKENILFTHRGLSGPAILQISSYLKKFNQEVMSINLLPQMDLYEHFINDKNSKQSPISFLKQFMANKLVDNLVTSDDWSKSITDLSKEKLFEIAQHINKFKITIDGSEGYGKAEVTAGGVNCDELSSKNMESKRVPGLFFIGEVVDVTGWLGGYNFQWAWSSGFAVGKFFQNN